MTFGPGSRKYVEKAATHALVGAQGVVRPSGMRCEAPLIKGIKANKVRQTGDEGCCRSQ